MMRKIISINYYFLYGIHKKVILNLFINYFLIFKPSSDIIMADFI